MCPCQHSEEDPLLGLSSDRSAGAQHIPLLSHRQSSPISKALVPDFWRSLALNQQGECQISAKKALFPHTEQECFSKACLWGTDFLPRLWWVSKENLLKGYSSFVLTYCTWTVFSQWKWKVSLGFKIRMQKYTQNIMLYLFFFSISQLRFICLWHPFCPCKSKDMHGKSSQNWLSPQNCFWL